MIPSQPMYLIPLNGWLCYHGVNCNIRIIKSKYIIAKPRRLNRLPSWFYARKYPSPSINYNWYCIWHNANRVWHPGSSTVTRLLQRVLSKHSARWRHLLPVGPTNNKSSLDKNFPRATTAVKQQTSVPAADGTRRSYLWDERVQSEISFKSGLGLVFTRMANK